MGLIKNHPVLLFKSNLKIKLTCAKKLFLRTSEIPKGYSLHQITQYLSCENYLNFIPVWSKNINVLKKCDCFKGIFFIFSHKGQAVDLVANGVHENIKKKLTKKVILL